LFSTSVPGKKVASRSVSTFSTAYGEIRPEHVCAVG
jgi:hypothetical protein